MIRPMIIYKDSSADRSASFIQYFANRVLNFNKNFLCAVTGTTGAGKSWLCGAIAEKYSKLTGISHNPKIHVIFSLKELLDLINSPNLQEILPPGSIIIFDEPQVSVNSRNWQSESNQILGMLTSTFRNMRLVVLFATPYLEFIDKQSRILFHAEIEVQGYDLTTGLTLCKPRILEWNPRQSKFYKKRLMIKYPNPLKSVLDWYYLQNWEVYKPSKEWIEVYEGLKITFTKKLNQDLRQQYIFTQSQLNKGQDLVTISQLYDIHGENYTIFASELPHLSPYVLERLVAMIKKQKKSEIRAKSLGNAGI